MTEILKVVSGMDENRDFRARLKITGLGMSLNFLDGESEDNSLGRNFSNCYSIAELAKKANEAGLKGIRLEIQEIEDDDIFSDNYE